MQTSKQYMLDKVREKEREIRGMEEAVEGMKEYLEEKLSQIEQMHLVEITEIKKEYESQIKNIRQTSYD